MQNILLVEDDKSLNRGITFKLIKEGYNVFSSENIQDAKDILKKTKIDLLLLDVGLPDGNGFDLCNEVRQTSNLIIIFLTACDEEIDIVTGLDLGADDYITKPFSLMILISKIKAQLRRNNNKSIHEIKSHNMSLNLSKMILIKHNSEILLSRTEFKLMKYLMSNSLQIITKEQFLKELWDIDGAFIDQNTIAVNIRRLREKVEEESSNPKYIKTVKGIGYIFTERCEFL